MKAAWPRPSSRYWMPTRERECVEFVDELYENVIHSDVLRASHLRERSQDILLVITRRPSGRRGICFSRIRKALARSHCRSARFSPSRRRTRQPAQRLQPSPRHHEVVGATTRLYMSADPAGGFVDVPTDQIEGYEPAPPDPTTPPPLPAKGRGPEGHRHRDQRAQQDGRRLHRQRHSAESANNPHAVSPKGAQGLMQLMPGTASKLGVKDSFDPEANVDGGVRYLRQLLELYHYDVVKALAAYNAGPQRVAAVQGRAAVSRDPRLRGAHHQGLQPQEAGRAEAARPSQGAVHRAQSTRPAGAGYRLHRQRIARVDLVLPLIYLDH